MRVAVVGVQAKSLLSFRGDLLRAMAERGHDVLAMAPQDDDNVRTALQAIGVAYRPVPLQRAGVNPVGDMRTVLTLTRRLRVHRADAVLAYAAKPVVYGTLAARVAGVPMRAAMITGVGSALGGGAGAGRRAVSLLLRGLYAIALSQAQVVFFQNPDDELLFRALGLVSRRSRVVRINGSGVDLIHFSPAPLPAPPIVFLMIARLIRDKGVVEYVTAARRVRLAHPEARCQLLGALDSNPTAISARQLQAWQEEGIIEYLDSTLDVRPYLAASHVYVLPSYGEGMPRSVLEAMAMGRPVITTDVPGCRETVEPGRNGVLVRARDASALADAMLRLIGDQGRLSEMGRQSREIAERRFDVHEVNRIILDAMGLSQACA